MTGSIKENDREAAVGKNSRQNNNKKIASNREYGGDNEDLIYKSGIPTLRSSAHRVKFDVKRRKHDPKPRDRDGKETNTTWLPDELLSEDVFARRPGQSVQRPQTDVLPCLHDG